MQSIHILGKGNASITMMLDALYEKYKNRIEVNIVSNISGSEDPLYKLDKIGMFIYKEFTTEEWDGKFENLIMGVFGPETKKIVQNSFLESHGITEEMYFSYSHPHSVLSVQSNIGSGVFIGVGTTILPYVSIGNLATLMRNVDIGHHTEIGKFVTMRPGCSIAGGCRIGEYTTIGMGANVFNDVEIGSNTIIGAGSLVTKSLPSNVVAYGTPAKVIRENKN